MVKQDLIILGLLQDGPKHGYEIKKNIAKVMGLYTPVTTTSIYYPLKNLEERKFITRTTSKTGKRPEKYIYSLTKKGNQEFQKLVNQNFLVIQRPYLNLDLSLYFLPSVKPVIAKRRLENRLANLKKIRIWAKRLKTLLEKKKSSYHLLAIAEHSLNIIDTEVRFTAKLIATIGNKKDGNKTY